MDDQKVLQTSVADAAMKRAQDLTTISSPAQRIKDHERRQKFRRLIDPGIIRPNSKEQAMASLKTLLKIAENLIKEPENPKFQQFKRTNQLIQRDLVNPKGALEYAVEAARPSSLIQMGFEPEVREFVPYYVHNPRRMEELKVGAAILEEVLQLENEKVEREGASKRDAKIVAEAASLKVKMAFIEDRTRVADRDERERQQRIAREARARSPTTSSPTSLPDHENATGTVMVNTLGSDPPPYSDDGSP
ncbi:hypothetical protein M378DRAFT_175388 [Amanita muscaria Koide BX008]|uniref:Uncharacterized protein n=1 Tax=Amanita muscaria (strain Koide BX008) TaxID=946122 RepID=A0A0C2XLS5_AMAMK|nr:hypothetical protein M378DRAFT_175388 [Amanita muscaria Koide BX008]